MFADVPHLMKLVRHHIVQDGGGLIIPSANGSSIVLDSEPFRRLRDLDGAEKRICPKLTDLCIEVCMPRCTGFSPIF